MTRRARHLGAGVVGVVMVASLLACAGSEDAAILGDEADLADAVLADDEAALEDEAALHDPVAEPDTSVVPTTEAPVPPARSVGWAAPRDRTRRLSILASGDILIHESVWESARSYAGGGDDFDFSPMFEPITPYVAGADLALCHLEVPLSGDNSRLASFPMFSAPYQLADAIAGAGYDGCSFASNHVLDRGVTGIEDTLGHLDRVGVGHAGAARSPDEADEITTYEVRGTRVAHLSYTYGYNGLRPPVGEDWRSNLIDIATILDDAARARAEGAEVVVLSLHWGDEYVHEPNRYQLDVATAVAPSSDIDLIIGHHPHVIQPVEVVGGTPVTYSVGNQLSNMLQPERRDGVLFVYHLEAPPGGPFEVVEMSYLPTQVELPGHRIVPAPPDSWERTAAHLRSRGAELVPVVPD